MHKVLIIDDEKDICFLISEILKDENYNTSIALNVISLRFPNGVDTK